jgi:retron-type reverse transcriptase
VIAHPSRELKEYQRTLTKYLENMLRVSDFAFAYRKGRGIKENAKKHRHSKYLLKMDFENFFNSITPALFFKSLDFFEHNFDDRDLFLLKRILFWSPSKRVNGKLVLSVGAPSSPFISNFIMYVFDEELGTRCASKGICYTRYADDLTFSTSNKDILFEVPQEVRLLAKELYDGQLTIKESKTVFSSKAHNRHVTGITITNEGDLSLGRERKRYISALVHKYRNGVLPSEDLDHLKGLLAFSKDIEPNFFRRIEAKYSKDVLSRLMSDQFR